MEQLSLGTLLVCVIILMFIIATVYGIINGIVKAIIQAKQIKSGKSFEQLQQEAQQKADEKKLIERKKYESNLYCVLHPLGWINNMLFEKLEKMVKGERK